MVTLRTIFIYKKGMCLAEAKKPRDHTGFHEITIEILWLAKLVHEKGSSLFRVGSWKSRRTKQGRATKNKWVSGISRCSNQNPGDFLTFSK